MKKLCIYSAFMVLCALKTYGQCGIITTVAGNGTGGYSGDGGAATTTELYLPTGVVSDGSGNLYIADRYNDRIRKVSSSGIISTVAGNGTKGYSGDGGAATAAELYLPFGVALDGSGNLYIADGADVFGGNNRIRKVSASGIISTVAGNGTGGYSGDGGPATAAALNLPTGVVADGSGNLYIADYSNNRVRKVNASGIISTVAGNGTGGYSGDGSAATAAELYYPESVAFDGSGNLYIADYNNNCIRKMSTSGIISTVAGNGTAGYSGNGGAATIAELHYPESVTLDGSGNIYIADGDNNVIREVSTSGIINTVAGNGAGAGTGSGGYSGDGGAATAAGLYLPFGVAVDGSGNLYIADTYNHRIRKVSGNGTPIVSAITGTPTTICAGSSTNLTDATTGGVWSSSNTGAATVNSSGTVYGVSSGSAGISYTASNTCGSTSVFQTVTVNSLPSAGSITGTTTFCAGAATTLSDGTASAAGVWSSSNTGIATVTGSGAVSGGTAGAAIISYSVTNVCSTAVSTTTVTVIPLPSAIAGPDVVCSGSTVTLSDATAGGTWSSSNTSVATINSAGFGLTGASQGTATISYANGCGSAATVTVTVDVIPAAPASIITTALVCPSSNAIFTTPAVPGATSYNWSISGTGWSGSSTGTTINVNTGTGTGTLTVSAVDGCGTSADYSETVTPSTGPGAATFISGPNTPCGGTTATFTTPAVTTAGSYMWTVSGTGWSGSSTTNSINVAVGSGNGTISVSPVNICGPGTAYTLSPIIPLAAPTATFVVSSHIITAYSAVTVVYTGSAPGGSTFSWNFSGGYATPGTGSGAQTVYWTTPGQYIVFLTVNNENGCSASYADTVRVLPGTGIQNVNIQNIDAGIAPNPNNGDFDIVFSEAVNQPISVKLFDMQGHITYSNDFTDAANKKLSIVTNDLPPGIYTVTIYTGQYAITKKLTIYK